MTKEKALWLTDHDVGDCLVALSLALAAAHLVGALVLLATAVIL